ncbi:hypothetical protein EVAR_16050_1 [Eumeta japonica]|uniref:Uncharacterized protein n=1 Tax=Eumeta variegata TaxID=151549 RepID=A0A4C1W084_EUMVA|nr:hypothetical protein EVAR_16050_1 [Eumeta japonica]
MYHRRETMGVGGIDSLPPARMSNLDPHARISIKLILLKRTQRLPGYYSPSKPCDKIATKRQTAVCPLSTIRIKYTMHVSTSVYDSDDE